MAKSARETYVMPTRLAAPLIPIGGFEYVCMIMVSQLSKAAYLKEIQRRLQETVGAFAGRTVNGGQVSGALRSLEKRGLLTSRDAPNPSGRGGPIVIYSVTESGARLMRLASAACEFANVAKPVADEKGRGGDEDVEFREQGGGPG